jgi:hypothetical protein
MLLAFYSNVIQTLSYGGAIIASGTVVLSVTFVVSVVVTFTDCRRFRHYYIVVPDPGLYSSLVTHGSHLSHHEISWQGEENIQRMATYSFIRGPCARALNQLYIVGMLLLSLSVSVGT